MVLWDFVRSLHGHYNYIFLRAQWIQPPSSVSRSDISIPYRYVREWLLAPITETLLMLGFVIIAKS